jgi:hypothetical protein
MFWLRRFERMAEEVVEGTTRRAFQTRLQPVELAKACARALDESRTVTAKGALVANSYVIHLHPTDFGRFARYQRSLGEQILAYLDDYSTSRGLAPAGNWRLRFALKPQAKPGRIEVTYEYTDAPEQAPPPPDKPRAPSVAPARAAPDGPRRASLVLPDGSDVELGARARVGRALENEIMLDDGRVSRHHAEVVTNAEGYVLRDLDSTNGTLVNGAPVKEARLLDGDVLSFGGLEIEFRERAAGA